MRCALAEHYIHPTSFSSSLATELHLIWWVCPIAPCATSATLVAERYALGPGGVCVRKSLKVTGSAIIACVLDWLVYQFLFAGL